MIASFASAIRQAVEEAAVDGRSVADVRLTVEVVGRLHGADDRQLVGLRELPVALVLAGHRHDRAGAVAHQHVVGDEDGDALVVHGVDDEAAGEHARLVARVGLALEIALLGGELAVAVHGVGRRAGDPEHALPVVDRVALPVDEDLVARPLEGDDLVDERMLGREHHERGAEDRVGARREDLDEHVLAALDREADDRAGAAADPVALHQLDRLGPVDAVEIGDQPVGVRGDPQHPLLERPAVHREVAAIAPTVGRDLFVGEHRAQPRTPVDVRLGDVGEAVADRSAAVGRARPCRRTGCRRASAGRRCGTPRRARRSAGPGPRRRRTRSCRSGGRSTASSGSTTRRSWPDPAAGRARARARAAAPSSSRCSARS